MFLATTCRDRKLRIFDPRVGGEAARITDGHGGIKGSRVVWMGTNAHIATSGFSKMSDHQVAIWETGGLGNLKTIVIDQSAGVMMPFWSDNNILFLAGKGTVEPIAFIVPRKADSFQSEIYPPAPSSEPSVGADKFFSGKPVPLRLLDLANGVFFATPTRTSTAPMPVPASAPVAAPAPVAEPTPPPAARAEPVYTCQPSVDSYSAPTPAKSSSTDNALAREKIRGLELQLESVRTNARKAAQALLDG
ncbi:hypothetical protein C8F01DRAFT_1228253 [Mycena amicta]|nr:hypothetical protein C8F01DRAFT_1228253 [Mycena amicta]